MATFGPLSQSAAAPEGSAAQPWALKKLKQAKAFVVGSRSGRTGDTQVLGARDTKDAKKRRDFQPRIPGRAPPLRHKEAANFTDGTIPPSPEPARVPRDGPPALETLTPSYRHHDGRLYRAAPEPLIISYGTPRQAPHPSVGDAQTGRSPPRPRKRLQQGTRSRPNKSQQAQRDGAESGEEDDNEDGDGDRSRSSPRSTNGGIRFFACPFYKYDPQRHFRCWGKYELTSFQRVKQHLQRCHVLGFNIYCPVCGKSFQTPEERDEHWTRAQCTAPPVPGYRFHIYVEEQELLNTNSKMSDKDRWYVVWEQLFPFHQRPDSPYLRPGLCEAEQVFRTNGEPNLRKELPGLLEHHLGLSSLPPESMEDLTSDILRVFFQRSRHSLLPGATSDPAGDVGAPAAPQEAGDSSSTADRGDAQDPPPAPPNAADWPLFPESGEIPIGPWVSTPSVFLPPNLPGHYQFWTDDYIYEQLNNEDNGNPES